MGCDINAYAEVKHAGRWEYAPEAELFNCRDYGLFGWLAGVRNYSAVPVLAAPRGLPDDASREVRKEAEDWDGDGHTHSWLSARELLDFDYDATFEDRRVTRTLASGVVHGGCTADPGEGKVVTYREFFGKCLTDTLDVLRMLGGPDDVRVVFWFDN
jgi:hypothetical protein